jgi:hypothetical protein
MLAFPNLAGRKMELESITELGLPVSRIPLSAAKVIF